MREVTHHPQRVDTHRKARILGGPVWQIKIYYCKDTAWVYEHPPAGKGLLLPCNRLLKQSPAYIY
jgi:hypothetical protein